MMFDKELALVGVYCGDHSSLGGVIQLLYANALYVKGLEPSRLSNSDKLSGGVAMILGNSDSGSAKKTHNMPKMDMSPMKSFNEGGDKGALKVAHNRGKPGQAALVKKSHGVAGEQKSSFVETAKKPSFFGKIKQTFKNNKDEHNQGEPRKHRLNTARTRTFTMAEPASNLLDVP